MNQGNKLRWKRRGLRWGYIAAKWLSTFFYVLLVILIQWMLDAGLYTQNPNTHSQGFVYLFCLIGIVAIWSAPEKRIARWTATVINALVFVIWMWVYIGPAITGPSIDSGLVTAVIGMVILVINVAVIWVGAKGGLESIFMTEADEVSDCKDEGTPRSLRAESALPESPEPNSVNETELPFDVKCLKCDYELGSQFEYCPKCGNKVGGNICSACQREIDKPSAYCPYCGVSTE